MKSSAIGSTFVVFPYVQSQKKPQKSYKVKTQRHDTVQVNTDQKKERTHKHGLGKSGGSVLGRQICG